MKMSEIPTSARIVPRFEKESGEADWWFDNREMVEQDMAAALESGSHTVRYKVAPASSNIITLDAADEQRVRQLADQSGESYENFVRRVIHEALQLQKTA